MFLVNGINIFASGYLTALGNGRDSAVVSILRTLIVEVIAIVGLAYLFGINRRVDGNSGGGVCVSVCFGVYVS